MALNSATIKSIQDIMRKDAGVDGDAQRLGQLTWLFFLKIFDDREQEWEITVKKYRSPIPEELRWRNWAADTEGLTGDGLLEFINNKLFPSLKGLSPEASPRHRVIHDVFEDAYQYMKNGTLVRQVINKINESLDFNRSEDRHIFGDLYEQILKDLQSAGNAGEYYTPRAVTQFMVDSPYTGIKTNLLFFTKGSPTKEIWYYEHPYPPGAKSYNKTKPIRIEEFDLEKAWWFGEQPKKKGKAKKESGTKATAARGLFEDGETPAESLFTNRVESPQAWRVSIEQIQSNGYNLDIKNPHDSSEAHADPDELLADYQILLAELQKTRDRLKDELFQALEGSTR